MAARDFDVIVVGGGHAGCEAAWAATGQGCNTLLITGNLDRVAQLSCNPAFGGLAKGQIVREIDALGGIMGMAADYAGIQFKLLNRSKGPAVRSLRVQVDKEIYPRDMKRRLEGRKKLSLVQGSVVGIIDGGESVGGVRTNLGEEIRSGCVIVTTGTFLNGLIHVGMSSYPGGRAGDPPSFGLSESLASVGHRIGRMKTGTPPRILGRSIDFPRTIPQYGDENPVFFSWRTSEAVQEQRPCFLTYTGDATHRVIRENLGRSPLYGGVIKGIGPRYCPSIEDKVVRFSHRERHQVFLEPEGLGTDEYYANGISTSLPIDVQRKIVASIPGLEEASITRPAYAIEYDVADPRDLHPTLESKHRKGLFLAGQINGTSGYEEAGGQGLVAGINGARGALGRDEKLILGRDEAYIGVLIDDLVTRGVTEPYRMFTSRAEFRLLLRHDNAHLRLKGVAKRFGLIDEDRFDALCRTEAEIQKGLDLLSGTRVPELELREQLGLEVNGSESLEKLLRRPGLTLAELSRFVPRGTMFESAVREQMEIEVKYGGYIRRQREAVAKAAGLEREPIPEGLEVAEISGLSREVREILGAVKPATLGQASRIPGMTPAAVSILAVAVARHGRTKDSGRFRKNP